MIYPTRNHKRDNQNMKAAVLRALGDIVVEDVNEPELPKEGLILRVEACSICGTDVKMWKSGHRDLTYPRVLGHEFVGVVEDIFSNDLGIGIGDEVQVWPGIACGRCDPCLRGRDNQCESQGIIGFNMDGGFAELVALPRESIECGGINLIPKGLGEIKATLAEPLACCINGQDACGLGPGDRVLIIGAGPIGLLHAMLARVRGAETVMFAEIDMNRAELALNARPDRVITGDLSREVFDITDGKGVDVLLIAAPGVEVNMGLISLLSSGGRLNIFSGMPKSMSTVPIDLNHIHYREISISGSYGCRSDGCKRALELLNGNGFDCDWIFTKRIPLAQIEQGLRHSLDRDGLKAVVIEY
jgi:L-iditol 2-dehydrogenase